MQEPLIPPGERATRARGHARASARLQRLSAEHEKLRKRVLRRRHELERFETELREIQGTVSGRASSLIEDARRLNVEIHASFADILDKKNLSRRDRARVREIYQMLELEGILVPADAMQPPGPPGPEDRDDGPPDPEPEDPGGQGASAGHRGRAAHLRDLRKTFLTLADTIHPDKVQGEEEKHARTEAMKELNRAYHEGDVAGILEIERAWNLESKLEPDSAVDEIKRRCQELEHKNALLAQQLRTLSQKLSALRQTMPGAVVVDVRRLRRERDPDPIAAVLTPLELELEILRSVATFVQSFQNGEMSLERFLAGPQLDDFLDDDDLLDDDDFLDDDDDDDFLDDEVSLDDMIELLQKALKNAVRRPGKSKRRRRRRR